MNQERSGIPLRILTYNIQAGTGTTRYRKYVTESWKQVLPNSSGRLNNLHAMADLMRDYDLVGLQEADGGSLRSGFLNQTEYLARHASLPYWSHQSNRRVGPLIQSCNGFLSKYRPRLVIDHKLPGMRGRGALEVRFGPPDSGLHVIIVHLSLGRRGQSRQLDFVAELVSGHRDVIVMGDMNCSMDSHAMARFLGSSGLHSPDRDHSFPSWKPQRGIDHILVSESIEVSTLSVPELEASDHRPVAMEVLLPENIRLD
ncbi:MAG: endonuclease [Lysobacteraceae bacterium]|nr:MAG: endonuclease [Xanthomonadaceae bacterium]